jgi:hypothetical protein
VTPERYGRLRDAVGMVLRLQPCMARRKESTSPFSGATSRSKRRRKIEFDADAVLRGVHIRDSSDAAFDGVDFVIQNLAGCAGASRLKVAKDATVLRRRMRQSMPQSATGSPHRWNGPWAGPAATALLVEPSPSPSRRKYSCARAGC